MPSDVIVSSALAISVVLISSCSTASARVEEEEEERADWNDDGIAWREPDWSAIRKEAAATSRPVLLLVHRTWCSACKQLRPKFAESKEIEALAERLVMVKTAEERGEFTGSQFSPDGSYFPRILFFGSNGEFFDEIAPRKDKYKYFHFGVESIVKAMEKALRINLERMAANVVETKKVISDEL